MKKFQILTAIALTIALGFANCGGSADADKKKKNNNLLILAAFLSQSKSSPESFYNVLGRKSEQYSANAIISNTNKTWTFNGDKSVQTITTFANGVNATIGAATGTQVNTYSGGNLIKSVIAPTGVTTGLCTSATAGSNAYTIDYSDYDGKLPRTVKCTPGTAGTATITDTYTYANGVALTTASVNSLSATSNSFVINTYTSGVLTDSKTYSGTLTAEPSKLSRGTETVVAATTITSTTSTYTAGASKTRESTTEYTIADDKVTRVLSTSYNGAAIFFSSLNVYAYTGNTSFTNKSYFSFSATLVTETVTNITASSANTYADGKISKIETYTPATGVLNKTENYTYAGDRPLTLVTTNVGNATFDTCAAYVFNDSAKTITVTTDSGASTCTGLTTGRNVRTITHDGFSGTNFNGFTTNESRDLTKSQKINFLGDTALRNADNNKIFTLFNL
jgi:hypothetical protein